MDEREMMSIAESILFVAGDAVSLKEISNILGINIKQARNLMDRMIDSFNFERRGLQIVKVNDSYQLATRPEYAQYINEYLNTGSKQTLSQAVLETLSIIAYKQPVTRMEIEKIRGVKCEYSLSVLYDQGLIKEVGRLDAPGRPILYGTTDLFLRSFGLSTLDDLPPLTEEDL